jgi:hypothetical protein
VTQAGYRHRILIVDRSGSIRDILAGQQSGLGEFLRSERDATPENGRLTVSLWDFDTEVRCMYSFAPADEVLTYRIEPRGATAMYDAIGEAVTEEGRRLALMPEEERPEDVTAVIASDGLENSSQKFSGTEVRRMLTHQQEAYGWRVIYMGTNQDALKEGAEMGVTMDMAVSYTATNTGSANSWSAASSYLSRVPVAVAAAASGQSVAFSEEERALAGSDEPQENMKAGPKHKLP